MLNFFSSKIIPKKYIIYGSSIVIARGAEYLVLLIAAGATSKENYGQLEFYKKVIEVFSIVIAFGFPSLILSYTKSEQSKKYFFVLSLIFVSCLSVLIFFLLIPFDLAFLTIPFFFYAVFFQNGILQVFLLINKGSQQASFYKIISSIFFYAVILLLFYFNYYKYSFVIVNYILLPLGLLHLFFLIKSFDLVKDKLVRYWKLLKKLLASSFTLVMSNFANIMFMYTDIFVISVLSKEASREIADYSFPLNIANALMIIPLTMVQVDIEKIKKSELESLVTQKKIIVYTLFLSVLLIFLFFYLTNTGYSKYSNTTNIFLIILIAKTIQSFNVLLGTKIMIYKLYKLNLIITLSTLIFNLIFSFVIYPYYGLMGVAGVSLISLFFRYVSLKVVNKRYLVRKNERKK